MKETQLDIKQLPKTQQVLSIHAEVDKEHWELKHRNLKEYIYKIVERINDAGFADAVVVVPSIHEQRKTEVENILKELRFKCNTQVEVYFTDNSNLCAVYSPKKKEDN